MEGGADTPEERSEDKTCLSRLEAAAVLLLAAVEREAAGDLETAWRYRESARAICWLIAKAPNEQTRPPVRPAGRAH